jgi:hypothetical protein
MAHEAGAGWNAALVARTGARSLAASIRRSVARVSIIASPSFLRFSDSGGYG